MPMSFHLITRVAAAVAVAASSAAFMVADMKGETAGDSLLYEATYEDKGRGCTGTLSGKGTVEKDASKAAGELSINDSCGGQLGGTFRLWREVPRSSEGRAESR